MRYKRAMLTQHLNDEQWNVTFYATMFTRSHTDSYVTYRVAYIGLYCALIMYSSDVTSFLITFFHNSTIIDIEDLILYLKTSFSLQIYYPRCFFGCCLIPFCINEVKDCTHTCPNCKNFLGVYRHI